MPDWAAMIKREGSVVWRTVYRLLGDRADADECFQNVFLAALECSRREPVREWGALLRRLAVARAMDRLRQRYRRGEASGAIDWGTLPDPAPSPSQAMEDAELTGPLRAALASLPTDQAEALLLHHLEDWSYREIAAHLSISVDAVGVLLHRARKRLRERLERTADGPGVAGRDVSSESLSAQVPEESR